MNIVKKNKIIINAVILLLLFMYVFSFYYCSKSFNVSFLITMLTMIIILFNSKLSIFSLKIICINYILLPLFYQYNYGYSYGLLEMVNNIHYMKLITSVFIYNIIWLFLLSNTNILKWEQKKIIDFNYHINEYYAVFLCLIAISSAIIAFPQIPFTSNQRFVALLPGNAWNHITIVCMILLIGNFKKQCIVKFTYSFCILWFLSHYERVDMIGFLVAVLFVVFIRKNIKINCKQLLKLGTVICLLVVIMIIVGETRSGRKISEMNSEYILSKVLVQSTAADEAYLFNTSIDYNNKKGNIGLYPYKVYLYESIPFINKEYGVSYLIRNNYYHPGGEYLLCAPYMSYKYIGVVIFALIEYLLLFLLIRNKSIIGNVWYMLLLCTVFRVAWYGVTYIETACIYIIPGLLLLSKFFKKGISINHNSI